MSGKKIVTRKFALQFRCDSCGEFNDGGTVEYGGGADPSQWKCTTDCSECQKTQPATAVFATEH